MKKVLLIIFIVLILAAIPLTVFLVKQQQEIRQRAVPATTLYLEPATVTQNAGDIFTLSVMINTSENQVSAAELHLSFDATYLEAVSIQNGTFLENVLVSGEVGTGTASITLGASPQTPKQGTGTLAVLSMRALADTPTPTQVSFASTTQVAAIGEGAVNVLVASQPAVVTIGAVLASPSPSPSDAASPTPTPGTSPSPTPSATPGGASPSPSPSASPAQVTQITSPADGATTTNRRPTISGTSFANGLMILSTNPISFSAATFYANASGNWSYTPTSDMALGAYTLTVTGENSSGTLETDTSTVTISSQSGGTVVASPTPTPTSSPVAGASPVVSATPGAVPVTGSTTPTLFLIGLAFILLTLGLIPLAFSKREV